MKKDQDPEVFSFEIVELKEGLDKMDSFINPVTPSLSWFLQKAKDNKRQIRKKWMKELSIFWIVAMIISSAVFFIVEQQPMLFISTQLLTIIVLFITVPWLNSKKVNS